MAYVQFARLRDSLMNNTYKAYLAIGIGGIVGASSRYGLSILVGDHGAFPTATLVINLIGCFLLSCLLNSPVIKRLLSPTLIAAIGTGIIGSFTTFSTVTVETMDLIYNNMILAILYVLLSIFGGLYCSFLGYKLANKNKVSK